MDREKVIEGIEAIREFFGFGLPSQTPVFEAYQNILTDALAMLKEQDAKEGYWIVLEFCANEGIYCSECHMKIFNRTTKPKKKLSQYCPHCGSRNEEFYREGEVVFR